MNANNADKLTSDLSRAALAFLETMYVVVRGGMRTGYGREKGSIMSDPVGYIKRRIRRPARDFDCLGDDLRCIAYEQLVIHPKFTLLFSDEDRAIAQRNLHRAGGDPEGSTSSRPDGLRRSGPALARRSMTLQP